MKRVDDTAPDSKESSLDVRSKHTTAENLSGCCRWCARRVCSFGEATTQETFGDVANANTHNSPPLQLKSRHLHLVSPPTNQPLTRGTRAQQSRICVARRRYDLSRGSASSTAPHREGCSGRGRRDSGRDFQQPSSNTFTCVHFAHTHFQKNTFACDRAQLLLRLTYR